MAPHLAVCWASTVEVAFRHSGANLLLCSHLDGPSARVANRNPALRRRARQSILLSRNLSDGARVRRSSARSVASDLDALVARARSQEEALAQVAKAADEGAVPADDLLDAVRGLSASAREYRQRLQALRRAIAGAPLPSAPPKPLVLVVNDAGDDRELTASVLESAGVNVITATNGLEAVLVANYAQPALVLMDVNMPLLDGIEAARLLKTHPATQHLTLVAHTAWPQSYEVR